MGSNVIGTSGKVEPLQPNGGSMWIIVDHPEPCTGTTVAKVFDISASHLPGDTQWLPC